MIGFAAEPRGAAEAGGGGASRESRCRREPGGDGGSGGAIIMNYDGVALRSLIRNGSYALFIRASWVSLVPAPPSSSRIPSILESMVAFLTSISSMAATSRSI
jgi:hypothetical protein